jgi:hypothetical protein
MPCHHKLEQYLDAYIKAAGVADDRKGALFRSAIRQDEETRGPCNGVRCLVQGAAAVLRMHAIETAIGCHTFRAIEITDYLTNGERIEVAQSGGEVHNRCGATTRILSEQPCVFRDQNRQSDRTVNTLSSNEGNSKTSRCLSWDASQ